MFSDRTKSDNANSASRNIASESGVLSSSVPSSKTQPQRIGAKKAPDSSHSSTRRVEKVLKGKEGGVLPGEADGDTRALYLLQLEKLNNKEKRPIEKAQYIQIKKEDEKPPASPSRRLGGGASRISNFGGSGVRSRE